jgi:hypothetical protein
MPFLILQNVCAAAYPPPLGFLCEGFWRRVGGSTVFHEGFFFIFFSQNRIFIKVGFYYTP